MALKDKLVNLEDLKVVGDVVGDLKSAVGEIEQQFPTINGKILIPSYELGTRYVSNGAEAWSSNNVRMSTKRGEYVSLKSGDIVTKVSSTIQYFGGGYSTDNGTSFVSISAQSGQYVAPANGIYFFWLSKPNDAVFTDDDIENGASYIAFNHPDNMESKMTRFTELDMVEAQLPELNGAIVPPTFDIGTRYINNGADTWLVSNIRMSVSKGKYIELKQGDIVAINGSYVYAYGGGYSTDNGSTWNAISNRIDAYTAPANGIYFFCLAKQNDATFSESETEIAWKYISFTRPNNIKETVEELVADDATDNIKTAIGYEIAPLTPTDYYTMTNPNKGLNYLGELVDDSGQNASDYIELTNLYDIARVVPNTTKYGLGSICYYTASKQFIAPRVQPGTDYSFSIYNGETVAWLSIDKTVANAKYVRFCGENNRNYKYWVVYNAPQASVLDDYSKYKLLGKKIVNFGDSIFGLTRPPKDVSSYLANITGATVYNAGFGGCEMSNHADANYNPFSMCNLADAIATGTWTAQESAASASGMPAYFAETVAMLKSLDFSKIDIATIGYGTNDWNNGTQLDGGTNTDKTYYADALRYSIETLLTAYPNLKIFVCTQTYRFFMNASYEFVDDCTTHTNSQGKTLTDFVDKTIEVANAYNIPYIDNYHIGINKFDRSYYFYSTDSTHPMPIGNQLIAENMANKLY